MRRRLLQIAPPALTAAILGTLFVHELDHYAPESMKVHLRPLLGRRREPPEEFSGDAAPQKGVFAGNDRNYSAVLVVQASPQAEKKLVARQAARACLKWSTKDVEVAVGLGPRVWESVKGLVPLGNTLNTDFKLKDRAGEKTRNKTITASGGDIFVHVQADSQDKCIEVVRSVMKEFENTPLAWSEDVYGHSAAHPPAAMCPSTTSWMVGSANACKIACVPKVGASFALFQRWDDDFGALKGKAKPLSNHSERMHGFDQEGNKLEIVKHTARTGRIGSRAGEDKEGMLFVAYSADPRIFDYMLDRMVGKRGGAEDAMLASHKCTRAQLFYIPSQTQVNALGNSH